MGQLRRFSQEQKEFYQKNGFAKIPEKIFTDEDYKAFKDLILQILREKNPAGESTAVPSLHAHYPEVLFWILSDNVLNAVEDILGPNIGFWTSTVFYKKPQSAEKAYWHQDTAYVYRYNLFEDKNLINMTISFGKTDIEAGCLRYIPETQNQWRTHDLLAPKSDLITYNSAIREEQLATERAVYMELDENEASFHNINTVHGSEPNRSAHERITLSCRFFSASSPCHLEQFRTAGLWPSPYLVRGEDVAESCLQRLSLRDIRKK